MSRVVAVLAASLRGEAHDLRTSITSPVWERDLRPAIRRYIALLDQWADVIEACA